MRSSSCKKSGKCLLTVFLTLAIGVAGWSGFVSSSSAAEKYPVKPVTIIVPFSPGGSTDLNARLIAQYLSKHLGQPVVVENRPGAGGVEGTNVGAKARPDGYTLVMNSVDSFLTPHFLVTGATNPKDIEPIALLPAYPRLLVASEKAGFKTVQEMLTFAKNDPKKLLVGINPGSGSQIDTVTIMKAMKIEPNYVPFKGGGERNIALAGGHLHVSVDGMGALKSYVEAQKVVPLGVGSLERVELYKEIPTLKEQGVEATSFVWEGFWTAKGTPADILQILEDAFEKSAKEKALQEQLSRNYVNVYFQNREGFGKLLARESARMKTVIDGLGLVKK